MTPGLHPVLVTRTAEPYDLGPGHPMSGLRHQLTDQLAAALGVWDRPGLTSVLAAPASPELLALAHDPAYLAVLAATGRASPRALLLCGVGTEDTPLVPRLHERSCQVVGASVTAAQALLAGSAAHAVNLNGGLHHAMPANASGFCVYNDVVVAIRLLLAGGLERICYVDLDAHHGDGVEAAFAADPRVLTISVHQDGRTLFPGSGAATDVGHGPGLGSVVNLPLPPGTADAGWLRAFSAVVPVLLRAHRPQVVVAQVGCDGHRLDPLTDLQLTAEGFLTAVSQVHQLAHELCNGRLLVLGGGGYSSTDAVPRVWTQVLAEVSGSLLPWETALPAGWPAPALSAAGEGAAHPEGAEPVAALTPQTLADGPGAGAVTFIPWDAGEGDPHSPLDQAVAATRRAVLPLHGLDPLVDR